MKATLYMATYNKNDLLPNTLYSIARQKTSFPYEVCIVDDCSDIDPEPIIRKFIPNAKYKRLDKQQGFDAVTTHVLDLASDDSDIIIMQSADVIHYSEDTIERLCKGVGNKTICMARVNNTNPPRDMYKNFEKHLPEVLKQWESGQTRGHPGSPLFFLGAISRKDYESIKCISGPHCDEMLRREMKSSQYSFVFPEGLIGFHQHHDTTTVPCKRLSECDINCRLKNRCKKLGWNSFDDYLKAKERGDIK